MKTLGYYDRWKTDPHWGSHGDDDFDEDADHWDDDEEDLVLDCGTPGCLFQGEHFRSECFTAEDCERMHQEAFWSEHADIQGMLSTIEWIQSTQLERMRDDVLQSVHAGFADLRSRLGLPARECDGCHETLHAGACDDLPF